MKIMTNPLINCKSLRNFGPKLRAIHIRCVHQKDPKFKADSGGEDVWTPPRPPIKPYDHLFPWTSMTTFTSYLADRVEYFDGHLLAINKPWGVGIHKPLVTITDRNSHLIGVMHKGSPRYAMNEALEPLAQMLDVKRLHFCKTIDRYMSGLVLLATDEDTVNRVQKSLRRSTAMTTPAMNFLCVTKGWPAVDGAGVEQFVERVGIKLVEMDELGDHKQPVIIPAQQLTNTMRRRQKPQSDGMVVKPVLCGLRTLDVNKTLGVALIELSTNVTKYNFIECYLAFKTSFVLGDNRFCRQVKHIMGTPMSIKPHQMNYSQDVEPLPLNIIKKLMVRGNGEIPVHIHHNRITLPLHLSKKDKKDVVIECRNVPDYFEWTLKRLDLSRPSLPCPQTNSD